MFLYYSFKWVDFVDLNGPGEPETDPPSTTEPGNGTFNPVPIPGKKSNIKPWPDAKIYYVIAEPKDTDLQWSKYCQ